MAAKGTTAKNNVVNKIALAFGADYIGEMDKKIYVWADDGGERVQIAISLTCPKTQVEVVNAPARSTDGGIDFTAGTNIPAVEAKPAEVTPEETQRIKDLMERLGL